MTEKIFWENPYLTELDTPVVSVDGSAVMLEQTILFAASGGQESDTGTIGGFSVLRAWKDDHDILYELPEDHTLCVGENVHISVSWERRYRLMRLHFAAELVLELTYRQVPGIEKIGAHISEEKARLDFAWGRNISDLFPSVRSQVAHLIEENHQIVSAYSDRERERRYWEIEGFAKVPCGGTHLRRTGEIGNITLKRNNIGKGKERIEILLSH